MHSRRSAAARAAVWDAFFRQALELLPTTLPQGLREVSSSLLTSLTAVDLATLERTLEFLATSAEPVDITADALPGDWSGGHYTVSDASRAAVQSFFNLSPAAAQSASGSFACEGLDLAGRAVCGEGIDFKGYFHLVEEAGSLFHNGKVGRAAHDDAYNRCHVA